MHIKALKKASFLLVILFAMTMIFTGCTKTEDLDKVTVNEVTHSVFYAPFYAAIENGYFSEENIEIDLINGGGSDKSMTALLSKNADIGLMGPETAVYVYNEGREDYAVIIGQLTRTDGSFLVSKDEDPDFTWDKLEGATIIGGRAGGMPNMVLEYVLKLHNLIPGENVMVDTSVTFDLMAGAFEGSEAQYVTLFEPTASLCEQEEKGYIVAAVGAEVSDIPFTAFMVTKSSLTDNQDMLKRFMNAVKKGQQWVAENDAATVAAAIAPQFPDNDVELLTTVVANYKSINAWNSEPAMTEEAFNFMQEVMIEAGVIDTTAPFEKVVDLSLF